ncbi:MAG: hypothetical protein LBG44_04345 [Gemmatimonadota bacterium]|jgi:hypothetical protein|nr:hypothetical protein [Gemmatimonadota bacterium]
MASIHPIRPPKENVALHDRAMENLRFIRETMEGASFTAVSGWGQVGIGVTALLATMIASLQPTIHAWTAVWSVEAVLALAIGGITVARKARSAGMPLLNGPGRKLALSMAPPLLTGAMLTPVLVEQGIFAPLPGMWLLLYGSGVVAAGSFSVRIVPLMGMVFMALGTFALLSPMEWGNVLMGMGFGVLHILFGALIAWRHGG